MEEISNATFCVIDIETTGLDPARDRICEIAFVLTTKNEVVHAVDTFINPGIPIPASASAIHHIIDKHVAQAPLEFPYGIKLPPRDCFVAHNSAFDSSFLPALRRQPWFCTVRLAKRVLPGIVRYNNQFLRYHLGLEVELPDGSLPHRALPDALVTASLIRHLLANLPEGVPTTVTEFAKWVSNPQLLDICNFGKKHKGTPWSDVPKDYLEWMHPNCTDLDPDTHFTIKQYLA